VIVALAGPNGAGKTTFYRAHLQASGLRLVNADILARELGVDAYHAARMAEVVRQTFVQQQESFVFETVFSDPVGDKIGFLGKAAETGYNVILCFIGIAGAATSEQRVAMRVTQGGHDVPTEKLTARFPRTLENLKKSIRVLPTVFVFDNEDLANPFRQVAIFQQGKTVQLAEALPDWMAEIVNSLP
jgi:predicted ABC-type ATPase